MTSLTPTRETDRSRFSTLDWRSIASEYALMQLALAAAILLVFEYDLPALASQDFAAWHPHILTNTMEVVAGTIVLATVGAALAVPFYRVVYPRLRIRRGPVGSVVLWLLAGTLPILLLILYALTEDFERVVSELAQPATWVEIGQLTAAALALSLLPVAFLEAVYYLRQGAVRAPARRAAVAAVVVLLVAPVAVGAVLQPGMGGGDHDLDGIGSAGGWSPTNASNYDDGAPGPYYNLDGAVVTAERDRAAPEVDIDPGARSDIEDSDRYQVPTYPIAEFHTRMPLTVHPLKVETPDGPERVRGHYALSAPNGSPLDEGEVIDRGVLDHTHAAQSRQHDIGLTSNFSRHAIQLETVKSATVYYDVVHPNGEIHRYVVTFERTDLEAAADAEAS